MPLVGPRSSEGLGRILDMGSGACSVEPNGLDETV